MFVKLNGSRLHMVQRTEVGTYHLGYCSGHYSCFSWWVRQWYVLGVETVCWRSISCDVWSWWEDSCLVLSKCIQHTQLLPRTHRVWSPLHNSYSHCMFSFMRNIMSWIGLQISTICYIRGIFVDETLRIKFNYLIVFYPSLPQVNVFVLYWYVIV